jgi:TnpA family transposase
MGLDRRQIEWINQHHVIEDALDEANTIVLNGYNRFLMTRAWGSGKRVSADGTPWDTYERNLLAERHIRYGGFGGVAFNHVSDLYVALFSRFIPCGAYEGVYILDPFYKNESDIQPDTVHADTHGQSAVIFGLAYILGIQLMPRIRNWKHLVLYRSTKRDPLSAHRARSQVGVPFTDQFGRTVRNWTSRLAPRCRSTGLGGTPSLPGNGQSGRRAGSGS